MGAKAASSHMHLPGDRVAALRLSTISYLDLWSDMRDLVDRARFQMC